MSSQSANPNLSSEQFHRLNVWIERFGRYWQTFRKICLIACLACSFLSFLAMVVTQHWAEHVTVFAVVNFAPPLLWVLPSLFLLPLAFIAQRGAVFALLAVLAWWFLVFCGWEVPKASMESSGAGEGALKVITFNRGQAQKHSLQPFLAEIEPDLVVLQDARGRSGYYSAEPAYALFREVREEGEFVLLSRHLIVQQASLKGPGFDAPGTQVEPYGARWVIDWRGRLVAIYNIHFPSPRRHLGSIGISRMLPQLVALVIGDDTKMDAYWSWRVEMARDLAEKLRQETLPWLLLGDMNTPPKGGIHSILSSIGEDLHEKVGEGFGNTFPGDTRNPLALARPWMRIDYVFSDRKSWEGRWIRPEFQARSQHLPLAAELVISIP
jgi:endonuclease/exonuclease/phosphatase (EEP) superfamily protein YafD